MGKKLIFVTGTRADFGKLKPLATEAHKEGFEIIFFVTGMHMLEIYGLTKKEVSSFIEFKTFEYVNQKDGDPLDLVLSKTIMGFSKFVKQIKPDMVVIHGDRIEAIACSLVCSTNYILSTHIEGGEVSGTIDEIFRHCNTKLCSIHMVSSQLAKKRVMQLGEPCENIFVIGSPEIDIHSGNSGVSIDQVKKRYGITFKEYGICIFHPVTSELDDIRQQTIDLFNVLSKSNKNFVVIFPNNDPGSEFIREEINKLNKERFLTLPSMRFNYFSELMKNCSIFIGNSSAGIREVPFFGICSIDIGSRQYNRAISQSIKQIKASKKKEFLELILNNWNKKYNKDLSYGEGNAAKKFVKIIKNENLWDISLQKKFMDAK